jgi:small basic protein (TIGR04137 family)
MSLDRSLKAANSLVRHRNVLTRAERITRLAEEEKWNDSKGVFGLPKVANRKMALAKAEKEEAVEGAVPGAPGAAPAAGGAAPAAAGAKGAAPAGAKGAAPAGKGATPAAGGKGAAPAAAAGKAAPGAKGKK